MHNPKSSLWWRDSNKTASGKTGAVHTAFVITASWETATAPPTSPASACCSPLAHPHPTPTAPIRSTGRVSSRSRAPAVAGVLSSSRCSGREARRSICPSRRSSTAHDPATEPPERHDRSESPPRLPSPVRRRQGRSIIRARRQPIRRSPPPDARSGPARDSIVSVGRRRSALPGARPGRTDSP